MKSTFQRNLFLLLERLFKLNYKTVVPLQLLIAPLVISKPINYKMSPVLPRSPSPTEGWVVTRRVLCTIKKVTLKSVQSELGKRCNCLSLVPYLCQCLFHERGEMHLCRKPPPLSQV